MKYFIAIVMIVGLSGVVYYFMVRNEAPIPSAPPIVDQMPVPAARVEPNAVVVIEQKPSSSVNVSMVQLAAPGFVVIHDDAAGQPGAVLGASALLPVGQNLNIGVTLSTSTVDGQKLHAVLHSDANNNRAFDLATDPMIQSSIGGPLDGWFDIATSSATGTPLTL